MPNPFRSKSPAMVLAIALALAACGSDTADTDNADRADVGIVDDGGIDLSEACPATVVIQTDWNPEGEHGWIYELLGDDYVIDDGTFTVSGSLVAGGQRTGVNVEVRSGGPAIGWDNVTTQIYQDADILLGFVNTDEAIQNSAEFPTVAVMSGMEKSAQMIMWDPETYPEVREIGDLRETGAIVRYFGGGAAYMDFFVSTGILDADQVDGGYDGTPGAFVADQGAAAQQGFGSAEPYLYEHEVPDWAKPVAYAYINDSGWEAYAQSLATRPGYIETYAECFALLVPIIQQSTIDYLTNPARTNAIIIEAVEAFDNGWVYTAALADYAVATLLADGLVANGPDGVLGKFDLNRVDALIEKAIPVYASFGQSPADGLTAAHIVTNQFLDESIGL